MKSLFALIVIFLFNLPSWTVAEAQSGLYKTNLEVAKYLYEKDVLSTLLNKPQLSDGEKDALLLAVYYKSSVQDLSLTEMRQVLAKYYSQDFSQERDSQVEATFSKLMKQTDDLLMQKDFSYLTGQF